MSFLQGWLLWGLLAASLPILIHLLNRWRYKSVLWAAISFVLKANKEIKGRKKLLYYLILASRTLALLCLILALARPLASSWLGFGSGQFSHVILLLDRSLSMEKRALGDQQSLREAALTQMRETLLPLQNCRFFLAESGKEELMELASPELLLDISTTQATDTQSDIARLLYKTTSYIQENLSGKTEIWILSDGQKSNWQPQSPLWKESLTLLKQLPTPPSLRLFTIEPSAKLNRSVRIKKAEIGAQGLELEIDIYQTSSPSTPKSELTSTLPLSFHLEGGSTQENIVLQGEKTTLKRTLPLTSLKQKGHGFLSLPPDTNPRDNVFFFTYEPKKTLLVSVDNKTSPEIFSLAKVVAPPQNPYKKIVSWTPALLQEAEAPLGLIFWEGALPEGSLGEKLLLYVQKGGCLVCFPSADEPKTAPQAPSALAFPRWGKLEQADESKIFILKNPTLPHALLKAGIDGKALPFSHLEAIQRRALEDPQATTLLSWDDGSPALLQKHLGKGQIFFWGTRPDYTWSNLADGYLMVPFLSRLSQEISSQHSPAPSLDISEESFSQLSEGHLLQKIDTYSEALPSAYPYTAGLYQKDQEVFALNRPATEEETLILTPLEREELLGELSFSQWEKKEQSTESLIVEVWKSFYWLALFFLLLEGFLSLPSFLPSFKKQNPAL